MKLGEKLRNIVGTVAPTLGTMLGGPFGALAGRAVQDALGVSSEAAALKMIETDPDALLKLRTAEMSMETRLAELGIEREQLAASDRASARQLAEKTSLLPQIVLASLFITGYFTILGLFFSNSLAVPESDVFKVLVGVLTAAVPQILAFFFGSSSGSKEKTTALAHLR